MCRCPRWLLGLGIIATLAANVAHGLGHGIIGVVMAAWPAVALVGSYELLMADLARCRVAGTPEEGMTGARGCTVTAASPGGGQSWPQ